MKKEDGKDDGEGGEEQDQDQQPLEDELLKAVVKRTRNTMKNNNNNDQEQLGSTRTPQVLNGGESKTSTTMTTMEAKRVCDMPAVVGRTTIETAEVGTQEHDNDNSVSVPKTQMVRQTRTAMNSVSRPGAFSIPGTRQQGQQQQRQQQQEQEEENSVIPATTTVPTPNNDTTRSDVVKLPIHDESSSMTSFPPTTMDDGGGVMMSSFTTATTTMTTTTTTPVESRPIVTDAHVVTGNIIDDDPTIEEVTQRIVNQLPIGQIVAVVNNSIINNEDNNHHHHNDDKNNNSNAESRQTQYFQEVAEEECSQNNNNNNKRRRRRTRSKFFWYTVILALVVITIVVVVVVTLTIPSSSSNSTTSSSSDTTPKTELWGFLNERTQLLLMDSSNNDGGGGSSSSSSSSTSYGLDDPNSPQSAAYAWLLQDDMWLRQQSTSSTTTTQSVATNDTTTTTTAVSTENNTTASLSIATTSMIDVMTLSPLEQDLLLERYAIVTFYFSTNGEGWGDQHPWMDPNTSVCDWIGGPPKCTSEGRVQFFSPPSNALLRGIMLPNELGFLSKISDFIVPTHDWHKVPYMLGGTIPSVLGKAWASSIRKFAAPHTSLEGHLPEELGLWTNLESLRIGNSTRLTGPMHGSFANWTRIGSVVVSGSAITSVDDNFCDMLETERTLDGRPLYIFVADCMADLDCRCCTSCCWTWGDCQDM